MSTATALDATVELIAPELDYDWPRAYDLARKILTTLGIEHRPAPRGV